ncbi:DUF4167 domain-containing protein [Rhodovulum sp. BSW8]|uniref:DUF4167 domain-containing protein n=1 Tax=Rhodovulum sp. BSW8 TaxID=2259645 RepID=UPI000DE51E83|nr:DUF4167 domain-containing protein [Rhodovulum sp. BSW8]RBO53539.1 DUF4167 domain-containing protein [Rhodovulum sp. BSW8]
MRPSKSRSRSKSNRSRSIGNIVNRVFDSSGPEGKVRGTPQQIIDKYNQLARDAHLGNDRVAAENFQQHAEHYARLLGEAQREQDARREQQDAQQPRPRERDDMQETSQGNDEPEEFAPAPKVASDSGTDVIDIVGDDDGQESTLVETPEEKPAPKPRRPRKPRAVKPRGDEAGGAAERGESAQGDSGQGDSGQGDSGQGDDQPDAPKSGTGKRRGGTAANDGQPSANPQREAPAAE